MGANTLSPSPRVHLADKDTRAVLDSIRRIVRALRISSSSAEKQVGLSGAQLFVLQKLADGGRSLSLNELARRTVTDQSSVSVVVQKLVKRGLVKSARSETDGRRIEMELTSAGRKITAKSSGAAQQRLIESLKTMKPAQRKKLAQLLDLLVHEAGIASATPSLFFEHEETEGNEHSR